MQPYLIRKFAIPIVTLTVLFISGCSGNQDGQIQSEPDTNKAPDKSSGFEELEKEYDARLGVYALHTGSSKSVSYNADERFAYASAHKVLAVGTLLKQKSIGELEEKIYFTEEDLVNYNPITEKNVNEGMTLKELSDASIRYSDNTAANLIFEAIGGPQGFKEALREIGDDVTEPERIEPELNDVTPGETRDTSTPKALAESLQAFTIGNVLTEDKQELLNDWLKRNTTGDNLIRAGVPKDWEVGDKTGSGSYGTRNDIAVIWPSDDDPIILAILSNRENADADYDDELIAKAAEIAVEELQEE